MSAITSINARQSTANISPEKPARRCIEDGNPGVLSDILPNQQQRILMHCGKMILPMLYPVQSILNR